VLPLEIQISDCFLGKKSLYIVRLIQKTHTHKKSVSKMQNIGVGIHGTHTDN